MASASVQQEVLESLAANSHETNEGAVKSPDSSKEERWPVMLLSKDPPKVKRRPQDRQNRDPVVIERTNLLSVFKLVTKELIESSLKYGRMLDSDHVPLQHFFIVLEHILRHGLKPKKGLLGPKKELWNVLELVEKLVPEALDITSSVRELPTVKSHMGRARAWIRLALMQKRLPDYFRCLVDKREELLRDFYEPFALILGEEAVVIGGLLVGLNVIDCNLCVKEEDLDSQQGVIDFSLYLRGDQLHSDTPTADVDSANMTAVLDQKNYLEELNRHLNATVTNLQARVENLQTTNALMKEDLAIAKNQIFSLQEMNERMDREQDHMQQEHDRKLEDARADMSAERETYQTSRAGLDHMYHEAKKKLEEETNRRMELEKELELQACMKGEMEMAMKLLEKDIHDKQDTLVSLRQQLDDIKLINLEMYKKLQACESSLKFKADLVTKLEHKMSQMTEVIKELEEKSSIETDLRIEREWRISLQDNLMQDRDCISRLQVESKQLEALSKDHEMLQTKHEKLQRTCSEHEETLHDLAVHLEQSKLKVEDLKEASKVLKEAVWTSDKDAPRCNQCEKEFSISRRKHHCRHCGDIYCHNCSDNTMPLPSSAKPVRVCDSCHTLLLQRYSAA